MKCMLDMDGVVADIVNGACKARGVDNPYHGSSKHIGSYFLAEAIGMTHDEFWNFDFDFWANLEWMCDGKEILEFVESAFGKDNVCLLTSPVDTPGCVDGKRAWIAKNMPDYKRRCLIGSAKEFCANPKSVLIDDHSVNTEKFEAAGGHTILVPRVWNRLHGFDTLATVKAGINRILFMHS